MMFLHHYLKLEMWQGLPNINKVKQYDIMLFFKISLFIQSWKLYFFLGIKKIVILPQNDIMHL